MTNNNEKAEEVRRKLAELNEKCFPGFDIRGIARMSGEKRQIEKMKHLDRVFEDNEKESGLSGLCKFFIGYNNGYYWIGTFLDDENQPYKTDYFCSIGLDDEWAEVASWISEFGWIACFLMREYYFDLNKLQPGLANHKRDIHKDFLIRNKRLVKFLNITEYRYVAAYVAHLTLKAEVYEIMGKNEPIQDGFNKPWHIWKRCQYHLHNDAVAPDEWIKVCLDFCSGIYKHYEDGEKKGMDRECTVIHDIIYGYYPNAMEDNYVAAAKEIQTALRDKNLLSSKKFISCGNYTEERIKKYIFNVTRNHGIYYLKKITYAYFEEFINRTFNNVLPNE